MWYDGKSGLRGPSASQGEPKKLSVPGGAPSGPLADALTQMRLGRQDMTAAPTFDPAQHGASSGAEMSSASSSPMSLDGFNVIQQYAMPRGGRNSPYRQSNARFRNDQFRREQMAAPGYSPDLPTIYADASRPYDSLFRKG